MLQQFSIINMKKLWIAAFIGVIFNAYAAPQKFITRTYTFKLPQVVEQEHSTCRVELDDTIPDNTPGQPILPQFRSSFEIPDGYEVESVTLLHGQSQTVLLTMPIEWGQPAYKPGDPPLFCDPDPLIYLSNELYPADNALQWRCDPTDGSTLFSLSFAPLLYNPLANTLHCSSSVTAHITLTEKAIDPIDPMQTMGLAASPLNPQERCDYLIISTSNLIARAASPFDFNALLSTRERSGFITKLLPIEWIYDHYSGVDQPARIRRFLQDAHALWGLQYLLIAGTHQMIPTRKLYITVQSFLTIYTDEIPADHIYYGCMGGSYDGNGNGRYGEYNDGDGGGDVDLTAEVLVGRFPVANEIELAHMVRKTLRHETAAKEDFFHHGFVSEKVNFGTVIYGEPYMEEIRNGSTTFNKINLGYTNSPYENDFITSNNLHDSNAYLFNRTDSLSYLNNNLYSINHLGHGARYQCLKLNVLNQSDYTALATLQNPFPYFIYSQACESGAFDTPDCFAEQIVTVSNAAAAVVMNSRNGWATASSVSGYSQFLHRYFWDGAFRGSATTYGQMNEYARRKNLSSIPKHTGSLWRWVYYELNLLGDPAMPVLPALLNRPPDLTHTPLINTFNTTSNYNVRCNLNPVGIFDPESIFLSWTSSALAGVVYSQQMERVLGNLYQGAIPPLPIDTLIHYSISASNRAGYVNSSPASGSHSFYVTEELHFQVIGSPLNLGLCEPDYGSHSSASGLVIEATCADLYYANEGLRYVNYGFIGTGSVPPSSTNRMVSFRIDMDSMLIWRWQKQHRVRVNSSLGTPPESIYWVNSGNSLALPPMERFIQDAQSNTYAFAGWKLDGVRSPAMPAKSIPQYPNLIVSTDHELTALYIPAELDSDGNQIHDWWELQYFGSTGHDIFADHDNDGYDLYQEFTDLSDPLDPLSFPAPPRIVHTPLQELQNKPGPFEISAVITDTHVVTNAAVFWRIRSGAWSRTSLNLTSNHIYRAQIAAASTAGDNIQYWIQAEDPSDNLSQSVTHNLFLAYPVADTTDLPDLFVLTKPEVVAVTNRSWLFNRGNTLLNWNLFFGKEEKFFSPSIDQLYNWNTISIEQPWDISTNRTFSPPYALHAALNSTQGVSHHASIAMPPVVIGADAQLSFAYWIDSETYLKVDPSRAFDGGIVEYSTDGGASFHYLPGPYTHTIYGYPQSPWIDRTPCFAGTGTGWKTAIFDLMAACPEKNGLEGQSVIFRFVYGGDDNTDHEGWYVDDILISPVAPPAGYTYTLPQSNPFSTAPGYLSELLWRNLPQVIAERDENATLILTSNDPVNPRHSFYWQTKIRQPPDLLRYSVSQITNGNGAVALNTKIYEHDQEPVTVKLEWSQDRGHHWHNASVTNIVVQPSHTNIPSHAVDGLIPNIPATTNSIPVTNLVSAIWNSNAPEVDIGWSSNIYMRITATSPWFETTGMKIFAVDNIAPQFTTGVVSAGPQGQSGDYLVTTNLISLAWPLAIDTPVKNPVFYTIRCDGVLLGVCSNTLSALLSMTDRLDQHSTITITPADPIGNTGESLELTALILDPQGDYDHDGATTAYEELAGTDATNQQSVFVIKLFAIDPAGRRLSWTTVSGRYYTVESTPGLNDAQWSPVGSYIDIPGTGAVISVTLPHSGDAAFFRVRVR